MNVRRVNAWAVAVWAAIFPAVVSSGAEPMEPKAVTPLAVGKVERIDPALDALVDSTAKVEKLAEGFAWSEGPVWWREGKSLLFSDIPRNAVFRWKEGEALSAFIVPSGYTAQQPRSGSAPKADVDEQGSNGLAIDREGRLVLCQHGDRRVARLAEPLRADKKPAARFETVADRWEGRRFNSPNDLALHSSGAVYFTDPPYGLEKGGDPSTRDIDFNGVYRAAPDGKVTLVTREMTKPNGIALTPDEKTLIVGQSDSEAPLWRAFPVKEDGSLDKPRVFFDAKHLVAQGLHGSPDGFKVDRAGNLFATGPGGVLVISAQGKHLGTIVTGDVVANCAFGDDGSTLYMTSNKMLCRVRLKTRGVGF